MLGVIMLSVIMLNVIMLSVLQLSALMLSVIMLSVIMLNILMLSVDMLIITMLNDVMLNVVIQSADMLNTMLSVIVLSAVMLIVIWLNVVAPDEALVPLSFRPSTYLNAVWLANLLQISRRNVTKLFTSVRNKLECLSLPSRSSLHVFQIKLPNMYNTHAATWWQKLAADLS
jgi:hypothetical protein